jgi:hypothetical protein
MAVPDVIKRTKALQVGQTLSDKERVVSENRVAGLSLNLPIYGTCKPTKVCAATCYAAKNGAAYLALPNAVNKQLRLYNSMVANPHEVAGRIVAEMLAHMRKGAKFLRWNGVGDLFAESVVCLEEVARALPHLPIWVVTRVPEMAVRVPNLPNVFVHFSLDRASLARYKAVQEAGPLNANFFFSYQEDTDEAELPLELGEIPVSVYFTNEYKRGAPPAFEGVSCPLNLREDPVGACERCGRCWSGDAVGMATRAGDRVRDARAPDVEEQGSLF